MCADSARRVLLWCRIARVHIDLDNENACTLHVRTCAAAAAGQSGYRMLCDARFLHGTDAQLGAAALPEGARLVLVGNMARLLGGAPRVCERVALVVTMNKTGAGVCVCDGRVHAVAAVLMPEWLWRDDDDDDAVDARRTRLTKKLAHNHAGEAISHAGGGGDESRARYEHCVNAARAPVLDVTCDADTRAWLEMCIDDRFDGRQVRRYDATRVLLLRDDSQLRYANDVKSWRGVLVDVGQCARLCTAVARNVAIWPFVRRTCTFLAGRARTLQDDPPQTRVALRLLRAVAAYFDAIFYRGDASVRVPGSACERARKRMRDASACDDDRDDDEQVHTLLRQCGLTVLGTRTLTGCASMAYAERLVRVAAIHGEQRSMTLVRSEDDTVTRERVRELVRQRAPVVLVVPALATARRAHWIRGPDAVLPRACVLHDQFSRACDDVVEARHVHCVEDVLTGGESATDALATSTLVIVDRAHHYTLAELTLLLEGLQLAQRQRYAPPFDLVLLGKKGVNTPFVDRFGGGGQPFRELLESCDYLGVDYVDWSDQSNAGEVPIDVCTTAPADPQWKPRPGQCISSTPLPCAGVRMQDASNYRECLLFATSKKVPLYKETVFAALECIADYSQTPNRRLQCRDASIDTREKLALAVAQLPPQAPRVGVLIHASIGSLEKQEHGEDEHAMPGAAQY